MKRTCQLIIVLSLPLLLCNQVMAQHSGLYAGGFIGGNILMPARSSDDLGSFKLKLDPGLQGSAVLGWDLEPGNPVGEGRIELEYTRRSNSLDRAEFAEGSFKGDGNIIVDSLLVNFFGVFRDDRRWAPYVGAGAGAARIEASDLQVTGQPLASGSDVVFAYQFGTGLDFTLTRRLSIDLGYRFFGTIRPQFSESSGQKFKMDYYSHGIVLGLRVGL